MKLRQMKQRYILKVRVNDEVIAINFYENSHSAAREEALQIIMNDLQLPESTEYFLELA